MAVSFDSLATTKSRVLGFFRTQLGDWDLSSRGFFGKLASVLTLAIYSFLKTARQIDLDAVPTSSTSATGLEEWAANGTGLSNGDGGYGRKVATPATGGVGTFTGTPGTIYPALSTLTASDGVTKFELTNGPITVGGGGTVSGNINATTTGTIGNQPIGAILTVDSRPVGGAASVTLTTATTGGLDEETSAALLARVQDRLRNPPKAITASDLRQLAEAVLGVDRAYVYPRRSGTGTADVIYTQAGTGQSRSPSTDPGVQDALDAARTVTAEATTASPPEMPNPNGHFLRVRIQPTVGNEFDWDSGATGYTVASYSGTSLVLNANAPNLDIAVNTDGLEPRIQICNTNSPDIPEIAVVTAYNNGTFECTLADPLASSPAVGDEVHAAGSAVVPIATALHDLANGLGPSKASGYADPLDYWDDTLRIAAMTEAALGTVDATGTPYAFDLVAGTQPTIDGASTNVQAVDSGGGLAPELLWLTGIAVTP